MKKTWLVMTAISSCLVILLFLVFIIHSLLYSKIYQGVKVEGMDLSGCSRAEATELLTIWREKCHNKKIMLNFGEMRFQLEASNIDFDVDILGALDTAWNYGREGPWWQRIKKIKDAKENDYNISIDTTYDEVKLNHFIKQWQNKIERPPRNATISMTTGRIIPDQQGYRLEIDAVGPLLLPSFIKPEDMMVTLPVITLYPEVTAEYLARTGIHEALSVYTTVFNSQDINRVENIKLAAGKANGQIIYPGKIFSFNDIVGPREKSYGFKEAMEIVDGEFALGVGGGICQLSSTLYNAVILANLDIIERYNHSKALSYVPLGRDATVVFGTLDFKFVNNTPRPLMILAEINGNELMVGIFGQQALMEKVEINVKNQEKIPPRVNKEQDDNLYLGETKVEKQGKPGVALTIMRVVRLKGKIIKQEILSKDTYPAEDTLLKVGKKLPPFVNKIQ